MKNIFVINPNTKVFFSKNKVVLEGKDFSDEISIHKISNLFLLNGNNLSQKPPSDLRFSIYVIDKKGNLKNSFIQRKSLLYSFKESKYIDILSYIFVKKTLVSASYMKKASKDICSHLYSNVFSGLDTLAVSNKKPTLENLKYIQQLTNDVFNSFLKCNFNLMLSRLNRRDPFVSFIKVFQLFTLAHITSFLLKNNINIYQNPENFCKEKIFPSLSMLFFEVLKIGATIRGAEFYKEVLSSKDGTSTGALKGEGLLLASKFFTEAVVHNKKFNSVMENLLKDVYKINKGEIDYKDFIFDRILYYQQLFPKSPLK
jgi:hypothetical protein